MDPTKIVALVLAAAAAVDELRKMISHSLSHFVVILP